MTSIRICVVCDLLEEKWPSMDLIGDMLITYFGDGSLNGIRAERIRPPMTRRFTRAGCTASGIRFNADRFLNRFWDYPRQLRQQARGFDAFHVVDHSYAQLILQLPADRTVVTCHDLDTFRCLIEPHADKRSAPFRAMVRRTLRGFQSAALVACPSVATRDALVAHQLISRERLRVVPLAAHPSCSAQADPVADGEMERSLGIDAASTPYLLHVGSTIRRKRIDVLLEVFAQVRQLFPRVRLIRVGGAFTPEQESMLSRLKLEHCVIVLPYLDRRVLAAAYRKASIVLLTSEREGFGLPVVEAMACGTPVVASDLPVLREVGGDAAVYCRVGDVAAWSASVASLLREREEEPHRWAIRRSDATAQAGRFSWREYARRMAELYLEVLKLELQHE